MFFNIFKKPKLHKNVLVLSALPEYRTDFERLCSVGTSDFVCSLKRRLECTDFERLWSCYSSTAEHLHKTLSDIEKCGGNVVRNFQLQDLQCMMDYEYVVLLAHHSDISDEIEIAGRMVRTKSIIEAIPEGCCLVLDITSCYSAYLLPRIKARIPDSKIIGTEIATSLDIRLDVLSYICNILCHDTPVLDAVVKGWNECPSLSHANSELIKLGGQLQSTVYAPNQAQVGEDFIISVFLHSQEDGCEVEILAKDIDSCLTKKKSLTFRKALESGDIVSFQLWNKGLEHGLFEVDDMVKQIVWSDTIESAEFIVTVPKDCEASSFIGKIIVDVNHQKVGDMIFKTEIVQHLRCEGAAPCADFEFHNYNGESESIKQQQMLLEKLASKRKMMGHDSQMVAMCDKCIELLQSNRKRSGILRVFISSTSDMHEYRQVLKQSVEACGMYADMYEMWGQENNYPRDMCVEHVLQSDIFVCILGSAYGFVESMWDKSMTEIEYRVAASAEIPTLIYIDSDYKDKVQSLSESNKNSYCRQEEFIEELKSQRLVYMFPSELSLALKSQTELINLKNLKEYERSN